MLRGTGRIVVLSGGRNRLTGVGEADTHLEILADRGVPWEQIIVEGESTNTLEKVVLSLPKIESRIDLEAIEAVVVVTKCYHCRRAIMTLKRHLPSGVRYYAGTCELKGIGRWNWRKCEAGRRRVLKERDRIPRYLLAGDIEEIREDEGAFV